MNNDSIKVANKIITYDNLNNIFAKMNDTLQNYLKIYANEARENERLDYAYQIWSFKDDASKLSFDVEFYDGTRIQFDKYENFMGVFNNRLSEIKEIYVYFSLVYSVKEEGKQWEYYHQSIRMWIKENKIQCDFSLNSNDKKLDDIYQLINEISLNARPKYNKTISKRKTIITKICFGYGFIPAIVIMTMLCLVEPIRVAFKDGYIFYSICCIGLGYFLGNLLIVGKVKDLYQTLEPEQKYAGYVDNKYGYHNVYKDDVESYTETSEVLIGKNADNLKKRKTIRSMEKKYQKLIIPELLIIIVISIALVVL